MSNPKTRKLSLAPISASGLLAFLATAGVAWAQSVTYYIPSEPLSQALRDYGRESGRQIIFTEDLVNGRTSHEVRGTLTPDAALTLLLNGTGLIARFRPSGAIMIEQRPAARRAGRVTKATARSPSMSTSARAQIPATLGEVVVTAEKREERLQDVPMSVVAINAADLAENNQPRLRDFFSSVPGFSVSPAPSGGNQQMLAIRGISSGAFGNPTVGVTVDDVPFGAFIRELAPDLDPSDLARIEVLRGPQGTLYGASSMGGLVKFVTVDPSTDRLFGRVQTDINGVYGGAEPGYSVRGAVNVPISDTFALRASAFTRQDPGYINNPVLDINGLNEAHDRGGRLSAKWMISDEFSLKLSALYQRTHGDGSNDVDVEPGLGDLQQNYIRGVGGYTEEIQAYSAIVNGRIGDLRLTSVSGYNIYRYSNTIDSSSSFGKTAQRFFGVTGASQLTDGSSKKVSQEFRASLPLNQWLDVLVGGFYTHEQIPYAQYISAVDPATGIVAGGIGDLIVLTEPTNHTEYAAFTDVTIHFTDRFDVQLGGRESRLDTTFDQVVESGAALGGKTATYPPIQQNANVFTYLVTPEFRESDHLMFYSRVASGYRPGRSNLFNPDPSIPRAADADRTINYEIGAKGDVGALPGLSFDAALFYIDWKDIQISLTDEINKLGYFANGSRAKSEGAELSLQLRPLSNLTLTASGMYDEAVLTEGFPPNTAVYGPAGSRLPYGAKWSGALSGDEEFPVTGDVVGYVGATVSYVGDRLGTFVATPARAVYPSFTKVDLRIGARLPSWIINLYANNLTDKRGVLGGGAGSFPPYAFDYLQPRTVGLSVVKTF